jgi:O-antigen ligase
MRLSVGSIAIVAFFALLPAATAGGGRALAVLLCAAALLMVRPSLIAQALESKFVLGLFTLLGWVCATSLWSRYPDHGQALRLAALVPLGVLFVASASAGNTRLVAAAGAAALFVLAGLLAVEALWDMPLNLAAAPETPEGEVLRKLSRGSSVPLALCWAAAAAFLLNGRPGLARLALALGAVACLAFGQLSNAVGFGLGLLAFGLGFAAPRVAIWAVTGGLAFWMLSAPFLTPWALSNPRLVEALPLSWQVRKGIWDYVCARILEQPWIGHGLDASRAVTDSIVVASMDLRAVQLHPHSASLQIWFETGAVGAALAALALLLGGWAAARAFAHNRHAAAAAAATLASLGVVANVSFGIWQEWWIATMFIGAALVGALRNPEP